MTKEGSEAELTHLDHEGRANMVDVSEKATTVRRATAAATVCMQSQTFQRLVGGNTKKGDVLATARIAGIQAAKRTFELIPLCHQISLSRVAVDFEFDEPNSQVHIRATATACDRTGVEMEALTAASVAALTLYDMLKAIDRGISIERMHLLEKHGGKTGSWQREQLD